MDCSFTSGNKRFRYRSCAIIIEEGHILFAKNDLDDYYYSIGGAVKFGETIEEAVKREVLEETGEVYEIDRLAFFDESFFVGTCSLEGTECHEISFYFLMKPKGKKELQCNSLSTCGARESVCWLPIDKLNEYKAFPKFLSKKLGSFDGKFECIVSKE